MYDITSSESFSRAQSWVKELQQQGNPNLIMALAGVYWVMGIEAISIPSSRDCTLFSF